MQEPSDADRLARFRERLARARAGDGEALEDLLRPIRRFLARKGQELRLTPAGASMSDSDLAQETCLDVMRGIAQFVGDTPQAFLGWVLAIHRHNAEDACRRLARLRTRECSLDSLPAGGHTHEPLAAPGSTPDKRALQREEHERWRSIEKELSARDAELLLKRFGEELTYEEIGRQLHMSPDAARMQASRIVRRLRRKYGGGGGGGMTQPGSGRHATRDPDPPS